MMMGERPSWYRTLKLLNLGEEITFPLEEENKRTSAYQIARHVGIRVTVKKTAEGYRLKRVG